MLLGESNHSQAIGHDRLIIAQEGACAWGSRVAESDGVREGEAAADAPCRGDGGGRGKVGVLGAAAAAAAAHRERPRATGMG